MKPTLQMTKQQMSQRTTTKLSRLYKEQQLSLVSVTKLVCYGKAIRDVCLIICSQEWVSWNHNKEDLKQTQSWRRDTRRQSRGILQKICQKTRNIRNQRYDKVSEYYLSLHLLVNLTSGKKEKTLKRCCQLYWNFIEWQIYASSWSFEPLSRNNHQVSRMSSCDDSRYRVHVSPDSCSKRQMQIP